LNDILVTTERRNTAFVTDPTKPGYMLPEAEPRPEDPTLADVLARPKFSATAHVAEAIEKRLDENADIVLRRNEGTCDLTRLFPAYHKSMLPLGLSMNGAAEPGRHADSYAWHPAARESFAAARSASPPTFASVYFPVLAAVLPKWINGFVGEREGGNDQPLLAETEKERITRRVLYLVSGYGAPVNASHAPESNSTEAMARVIKRFVDRAYPGLIDVRLAHSGNGVFRYDKNVSFVTETLRPAVARDRDVVAEAFGEEWLRRFKLTVALCDGTPARLHALMSSFRDMRPYLAHAFRLKRFWHAGELDTGDVDIQRWARAEAAPPIPYGNLESVLGKAFVGASLADERRAARDAFVMRMLVREMKTHRDAFTAAASVPGTHELTSFWLRKTRKPVLAILCVVKASSSKKPRHELDSSDFEFHRGVNLEVSMPTGSLCSERNAIGNALAANPGLTRKDMFGIAVLSLRPKDVGDDKSALLCRDVEGTHPGTEGPSSPDREKTTVNGNGTMSRNASFAHVELLAATERRAASGANGTAESAAMSADDLAGLNPLRPCGACKEWLNKIAEVNPGFRVVMFSDVTCDEVYVKEVGQC
jgi:cytidine deaminase